MKEIIFEQRDKAEQALTNLNHVDNLINILHNEFFCELIKYNKLIPYEKCFESVFDSMMTYVIESKKHLNALIEELSARIKEEPPEAGTSDGSKKELV